jgi:hypothetical protein
VSPGAPDLFGRPLAPDPRIALPSLPPRALADGPLPKVQFTVELVGQYSSRSHSVNPLLSQPWYSNLGQPNVFVLRPGENNWIRLIPNAVDEYDSILLAWDYLTDGGQLSFASASHLLGMAESFAVQIGRHAVSLIDIGQVDAIAGALRQIEEQFDAGLSIGVCGLIPVVERDLWIVCSGLGLSFSGGGSFDWTIPQHPHPVLSVTPIGTTESFSLANVQQGLSHQGVTVGFRLGTCPAANLAVEGAFRVADIVAQAINGTIFDDSDRPLTPSLRNEIKRDLDTAITFLNKAGLAPGSAEALKIFR